MQEAINSFLDHLHRKMKILPIRYLIEDKKNSIALLRMDQISATERDKVIENLIAEDYIAGPVKNADWQEVWTFGKMVKEYIVYIEISIGEDNEHPICITFRIADEPLVYPLKLQ